MKFEEMKKIWDSQNNRHIYAIDEEALHRQVSQKSRGILHLGSFNDWGLIIISLGLAAFNIASGIQHDALFKFPQSIIFIMVAAFIYWDRKKRLEKEGQSDCTLLGDLEQGLRSIDHQIRRQRTFVWWFLMPNAVAFIIEQSFSWGPKSGWQILLVVGALALSYTVVELGLRRNIMPRKKDLLSLRSLFLQGEAKNQRTKQTD